MLTFGWGEILLVVGIIVVVIGPKDLPKLIKQFSSFTRSIKKLSREFKNSLNDIAGKNDLIEDQDIEEEETLDDFIPEENSS